jgi:hypothetical protein
LACASSDCGSRLGTIASKAGPKKAVPAPYSATSPNMCQSCSDPVSDSTAIRATARPRTASAASSTRRRSKRSVTTPPSSSSTIVGTVIAMPTIESAVGAFEIA